MRSRHSASSALVLLSLLTILVQSTGTEQYDVPRPKKYMQSSLLPPGTKGPPPKEEAPAFHQHGDPTHPMILIPGVAGSILNNYNEESKQSHQVWVIVLGASRNFHKYIMGYWDSKKNRVVSFNPKDRIQVPLDDHGLYAIDNLSPSLLIGSSYLNYFHNVIAWAHSAGYVSGKTLFGFPYDWRQSVGDAEHLKALYDKVERVYTSSGNRPVHLVSHSMGGLLAQSFFATYKKAHKMIYRWTTITTPFQGAQGPAINSFIEGYAFENPLLNTWDAHQLTMQVPSSYELLPAPDFDWKDAPEVRIVRHGKSEVFRGPEVIELLRLVNANNTMTNWEGRQFPAHFNNDVYRRGRAILKLPWTQLGSGEYGPSRPGTAPTPATPHQRTSGGAVARNATRARRKPRIVGPQKLLPFDFYNIYCYGKETRGPVLFDKDIDDYRELLGTVARFENIDGDGTVPTESAKADNLGAVDTIGIQNSHLGVLHDPLTHKALQYTLGISCTFSHTWHINQDVGTVRLKQVENQVWSLTPSFNITAKVVQGSHVRGLWLRSGLGAIAFEWDIDLDCRSFTGRTMLSSLFQGPGQEFSGERPAERECPNARATKKCATEIGTGLRRCEGGFWSQHCVLDTCDCGHYLSKFITRLNQSPNHCFRCPIGTFKAKRGSHKCKRCPEAPVNEVFFQTAVRSSSCPTHCAKGHYRSGARCVACPPGTYKDEEGDSPCRECQTITNTARYTRIGETKRQCHFECTFIGATLPDCRARRFTDIESSSLIFFGLGIAINVSIVVMAIVSAPTLVAELRYLSNLGTYFRASRLSTRRSARVIPI